jgi:hypothetical protein
MKKLNKVIIKEPIWSTRSVGIADLRIGLNDEDEIFVEISYKTADGKRLYPGTYILSRKEADRYPTKILWNGLVLRIIPIYMLRTYKGAKVKKSKKTKEAPSEPRQETLFDEEKK